MLGVGKGFFMGATGCGVYENEGMIVNCKMGLFCS